jgi:hypothetical protein
MQDAPHRFAAAALVEDRLALRGQPADHRPLADLALGDEAHHPLAVQRDDVDPADVVGDEQHRPRQGRTAPMHAESEDAHQSALPPTDHPVVQGLTPDAQPVERSQHEHQGDRQVDGHVP